MADDPRTRSSADSQGGRREGRLRRLFDGLSLLTFAIAAFTAYWVFFGSGGDISPNAIKGYSFGSPEDALKSILTMRQKGEFTALRSFDVAFNNAVIDEKLTTLQIHKVREFDGRRILFISYRERGDAKYGTEAYIRDAHSGLWGPTRYEYYDVRDRELAAEMRGWLEGTERLAEQTASATRR